MDKNPVYYITETKIVTYEISHHLLGQVGVIEDQGEHVLMTMFLGKDGLPKTYPSKEYAMTVLNEAVSNILSDKLQTELDKIKAYQASL